MENTFSNRAVRDVKHVLQAFIYINLLNSSLFVPTDVSHTQTVNTLRLQALMTGERDEKL
jgi:hypothetical protein